MSYDENRISDQIDGGIHEQEQLFLSRVVLSLNYDQAKELFNELINAGRDMERRDGLNQPYISGDEYLHNVLDRYKPQ
jgi:hypothetical protein